MSSPDLASGPADSQRAAGLPRVQRFPYWLGLGVQVLLWFLLFLAIFTALTGGDKPSEFRYVGY